MSYTLKVTAVSGSPKVPSRTTAIIHELTSRLGKKIKIDLHLIELSEIGEELGTASYNRIPDSLKQHIDAIEQTDLVHQESLFDIPVLLAATGGSERHALVLDHQLRPLFSFFQALTLPIGVYATEADFENYKVSNPAIDARIDLAVERALPLLKSREANDYAPQPVLARA
jgi:FMN reductase